MLVDEELMNSSHECGGEQVSDVSAEKRDESLTRWCLLSLLRLVSRSHRLFGRRIYLLLHPIPGSFSPDISHLSCEPFVEGESRAGSSLSLSHSLTVAERSASCGSRLWHPGQQPPSSPSYASSFIRLLISPSRGIPHFNELA